MYAGPGASGASSKGDQEGNVVVAAVEHRPEASTPEQLINDSVQRLIIALAGAQNPIRA